MGHLSQMFEFDVKTDKKKIFNDCNNYACREGDYHNGLNNNIRFIDVMCGTREEAKEYINKHDRGDYDNLAVKYKEIPYNTSSKALEKARAKITECYTKYYTLERNKHFANVKSEFVGCKNCGSRIATKFIDMRTDGNHCPVCGNDLRPQTTLDTIERYKLNWNKAKDECNKIEKEIALKNGKEMWLVKFEFHV